jgi:hypothetical protein
MSTMADRVELCEAILELIERRRAETGDFLLGSTIERAVLDSQIRELENDIFNDPGAIEPFLIRRRRGEA